MEQLSSSRTFGGYLKRFAHNSTALQCRMEFAVFVPDSAAEKGKVPALLWLSGLTCTDQNFCTKATVAFRAASQHNLAIIISDTSPRGTNIEGEDDSYDFGSGAGFYVNATQEPWSKHYRMYEYVTEELPSLVASSLPVDTSRISISGHSMGGHGALICALKNPGKYRSVSAFAPIAHPTAVPWGEKAFSGYLGADREAWKQYDATELLANFKGDLGEVLVDQGTADEFYSGEKNLLRPADLEEACKKNGQNLRLRYQEGYDHSYYFVTTFIEEHVEFHATRLNA